MWHEKRIIRPRRAAGRIRTGYITLLCLLLSAWAEAGVPVISNQRVTDITTRSFTVTATSSEQSSAVLSLFAADCTTPVPGFFTALQQNSTSGNMRISVSGLEAATGYCYQLEVTSATTAELTTSIAVPVTTATAILHTTTSGTDIIPSGNDIIKVPAVHLPSGESREAILSTVELLNGTAIAPLSILLSTTPNRDYFNFNNLFANTTKKTHLLVGEERVRLTENHGTSGCIIYRFRTLPVASGGTAPRSFIRADANDIDASGGVNILDILRVVGGKGTVNTGLCFNSDLDLNADTTVDVNDLNVVKGGFNGLP